VIGIEVGKHRHSTLASSRPLKPIKTMTNQTTS
jgi:hypothetical protein